jgi:hypothetical protein
LPVGVHVRPRVNEIGRPTSRVAGEDLRLGPAEAAVVLQNPQRNAGTDNAGAAPG